MENTSTMLDGPNGSVAVVFGQANPEQQIQCCKLAAAAFDPTLPEAVYVEREEYIGQRLLARNNAWRFWCISRAGDSNQVLATCKTSHRDLLVRDANGSRNQQGYCVASVVTDPRYRKYGLASLILTSVAKWMDGPGGAAASMLYTSIGEFYVSRGWNMLPAFHATLSRSTTGSQSRDQANLPITRFLTREDIPAMCALDIKCLEADFEKLSVGPDEVHMAVIPTASIMSWLHDAGDFTSLKIHGRVPHRHGASCDTADTWLYWYHDVRKQQLAIQRVRVPIENSNTHIQALAALLLDALEEACAWNLPKVIVWDPSPDLLRAIQLLEGNFGVEAKNGERTGSSIPSLRWRGSDETKNITVHLNEIYAWN